MKNELNLDPKKIFKFFISRKVLLENREQLIIFELQLIWFLAALLFFSGIIIGAVIISLLLGCRISIVDTSKDFFDKNRYK